jgi:hypothetical protein
VAASLHRKYQVHCLAVLQTQIQHSAISYAYSLYDTGIFNG